jgi:hypothetical protein
LPPRRVAEPLTQRRPDVDDAVVLDRHERRTQVHDNVLDLGEDVVARVVARIAAADLDPHLVERVRVEAVLLEGGEEPVAVGNARSLDLNVLGHDLSVPRLGPNGNANLG